MEEHLIEKLRELCFLLMNTLPFDLLVSTLDAEWGAGCKFGLIALDDGIWDGMNYLDKRNIINVNNMI